MNLKKKPVTPTLRTKEQHIWKYVLGILFVLLVLHNFFGALTYNAFVIIDNAFHSSDANSPVFMWMLIGSLIGIATGSIIASKKFKLSRKVNMVSAIPAGIMIFSLLIGSGPLGQITPRPDERSDNVAKTENTDSSTTITNSPDDAGSEKHAVVRKTKVKLKPITKRPDCEEEITGVSVTVRSDSVRVYYRTAAVKDGQWSDWDSIFIPQPGQYALSGADGKVKANCIQYYYDVKHETTRSASSPFTKKLCNGSLTIDTY